MSCLSALGSQIFTFVSVPHEVLSLQHQVIQEYAKVALGPDFSHTFPSLIIITAICIALRRYFCIKLWPITGVKPFFSGIFKLACSWIIVNATLWYWLILQRVLYCTVWTYWTNDPDIRDVYLPWWRKVWTSFYPPTSPPPVISASLISWIVAMMLSTIGLLSTIYIDDITSSLNCTSLKICKNIDEIKTCRTAIVKSERESRASQVPEEIEVTDKSEVGSFCDESRSETSTDMTHRNITQREISPICYGTNWTRTNDCNKNSQREISRGRLAEVAECLIAEDNFLSRQLPKRRICHTATLNNSREKSVNC